MELELADKAWAHKKKTVFANFPSHLLENVWVESMFPYALSPHHEEAKRDTIGVTGRASAKLPHYMSVVLVYPMENEMPLVHHPIKQLECGYTNEDIKGLSERTRGHLMLKPKSKLM